MTSTLTVEPPQQSKSRSVSKNSSVSSICTENSVENGYLSGLQERLLAECAGLTKDRDWEQAVVLEIGCGCGDSTHQLVERLSPLLISGVLGIDTDQAAIDYAFSIHADEKTDFAVANVEDLNTFELKWGGRFDWVFSSHALLFVKDQPKALRNLMWCLRPGGRCFIAVPAAKPADLHHVAVKVLQSSSWKKYFEVLKTKQLEFKYKFASKAEYKEFLENMFAKPIQLVPEYHKPTFVRELTKVALKKMKKNKDGSYTWAVNYVLVLARRPEL
ncbi:hypothetical protein HPB47_019169 [Ixodes persulcatus]|uniref:Uncharacterized protein n=1 Tax=Ixodes persulcatus TaxID=34615 RepID=A0AC60QIW2_IXOPE|nr:hypothetical protein HPB47_019169 [Ixodes persulcatus]